VGGPETLTGLRQTLKHMAKGLFSEATQAAIRDLKHRPDEFTVELLVPPSGWRFEPRYPVGTALRGAVVVMEDATQYRATADDAGSRWRWTWDRGALR
jgi:hypothetical protein